MREAAERAAAAARDVFAGLSGARLVDPAVTLPAEIALDLSGEAVRARLCTFTGPDGREMALRPDVTLPLALERIAALSEGEVSPAAYVYCARAFRLPATPGEPVEFTQVGLERYGAPPSAAADIAMIRDAWFAVRASGLEDFTIRLGDVSLFPDLIAALDLHPLWTGRILRAFRSHARVSAVISADTPPAAAHPLARMVEGLPAAEAARLLDDTLRASGIDMIGHRSPADILERLAERRAAATLAPLPAATRELIHAVLSLEGCPGDILAALEKHVRAAGLTGFAARLEGFRDLVETLSDWDTKIEKNTLFSVSYGRRFNYYDGIAFELVAPGAARGQSLANGGRYDTLIAQLSGGVHSEAAIGAMVRPDRIAAALASAGATS